MSVFERSWWRHQMEALSALLAITGPRWIPPQGPHWPTKLQAYCTNQLPMQSPGTHDKHSLHLVSWKIWCTRQKPVWFQKASQHNGPPGESRKVRPRCLCTETTGSWSFRWSRKGLWDNLAIWYRTWPAQDWAQRQIACFRVGISQGSPNSSQNRDHTLWWILPRGRCPNWWRPGCDIFWTED